MQGVRCEAGLRTSSMTRCCGSIEAASEGLMPKQAASNKSHSSTNPPDLYGAFSRC